MKYFSEREEGERPRSLEEIGEVALGGIEALIRARVEDRSFGATYPETCDDGAGPVGTDATSLWQAMQAEIPRLERPPWQNGFAAQPPRTLDVLDIIEFCWRSIAKPIQGSYHKFFQHYHLRYEVATGQDEFRVFVNRIFRRNGIAYELTAQGLTDRLAPVILREDLAAALFHTGDSELDRMLETARRKFIDPDEAMRREALEVLWDAWERLKTLGSGSDKQAQARSLLDQAAGSASPKFREALEREAKELTWIGNNLQIHHSETSQERLAMSIHVDYLFHRLFGLMRGIIRTKGWG